MPPAEATVYVVDDDRSVREGVSSLLRSLGLRVQTFASAHEFLGLARPDAPACLVLDVLLPDGSGLDLPRELESAGAAIPIIYITGHGTIAMGVRAVKAGAVEFLTKPFQEEELIAAVEQALDLDQEARRERAERGQLSALLDRLTPREREVLAHIVEGRQNKQIAAALGTAEQTVKQHRGRVMRKLGVGSVAELVRLVERVSARPAAAPDRPAPAERGGPPPIVPT